MKYGPYLLLILALLASGCNRAPKNNEAVRQGVIEHLQKQTGLDVNAMNIEITSVNYRGNEADAVVAFRPKNMPGEGMSMNYTLEVSGGKWTVKKRAGQMGGAAHPGAETAMPPGHPPAESGTAKPSGSDLQLPPGHPPMPQVTKPKPAEKK